MRGHRCRSWLIRAPLAISLTVAVLAAGGCGGSSSPFTGARHVPAGFWVFRGAGFSLAAPAGYEARPGSDPTVPAGVDFTRLTQSGASPQDTNTEIAILENPHLTLSLDRVVANLHTAQTTTYHLLRFHTELVRVPGAREARVVRESYVGPFSSSDPVSTRIDRTWLMVLLRPGVLLDVIAANEPGRGGRLNPEAVINSFRLGQ